jgi:hypothetical protein
MCSPPYREQNNYFWLVAALNKHIKLPEWGERKCVESMNAKNLNAHVVEPAALHEEVQFKVLSDGGNNHS